MGFSNNKWRKLLTILMIINLCFILFSKISRVFASFDYITITNLQKNQTTVVIGSTDYGGTRTIILPEWIYDFSNICIIMNVNENNVNTKTGNIIFSNDKILYGNNNFYTDTVGTYYRITLSLYGVTTVDLSSKNLSDYTPWVDPGINLDIANLANTEGKQNFHYLAFLGTIYDYNNQDTIYDENLPFRAPYFTNLTEIENGYPDGVFVSRGDYSENDALYFHLLKITNTIPDGNQSTYYYDSKVFKLIKNSKYYQTYDADTENKYSYYYIQRSALTLDTNSSYLYVLSDSGDSITNSYGILQPDNSLGIYDVVESDTAGVISEQQALNDKMTNIDNNQQEIINNSNNINSFLNENTVSSETEENVDTNLNFNNSSPQFADLQLNFISRLTSIVGDFGNYTLDTIDTINIPVPHSNNTISLRSDLMTDHIPNDIRLIITAFWFFIFGKYFLNYLLLIYKLITTGQLIDYYASNDEIIVTEVL